MKEYSVSQINKYIGNVISSDFVLRNICVVGEVSNCKYHNSGHIYFTLKDEHSNIKAVMWKSAKKPDFRLTDGMNILVVGNISVYEAGGYYQISAKSIEKMGIGLLYEKLAILKKEFEESGYFSSQYKKEIPRFSRRIGVVTAIDGAAIRDIETVARQKNRGVEIFLYPAIVQGVYAKESIVKGIKILDKYNLDVIIIGRGGGSIEDLWAFNESIVAKAVFCANTPIISAVGHEIDDTLTDLIADKRAATPTDAARIGVCDVKDILNGLFTFKSEMTNIILKKLQKKREFLLLCEMKLKALNPKNNYLEQKRRLDSLTEKLNNLILIKIQESKHKIEQFYDKICINMQNNLSIKKAKVKHLKFLLHLNMNKCLQQEKNRLIVCSKQLNALSPLNLLSSGYGYVENKDGTKISSVNEIEVGEMANIHFTDGTLFALVKEKKIEKR